jgi:AcrR family transcriptional regulator
MTTTAPTATRTQLDRQAISDAAMATAAVSLICERGPAATTLKDVGVRAGYSRGLAGYRFGSKAGLWSFLVHTIGEEWLAELRRAVAGTGGLATLHAALDAHRTMLLDSPQRIRAFYILWFDAVGPDPTLRGVQQHRAVGVQSGVQRGQSARPGDGATQLGQPFLADRVHQERPQTGLGAEPVAGEAAAVAGANADVLQRRRRGAAFADDRDGGARHRGIGDRLALLLGASGQTRSCAGASGCRHSHPSYSYDLL